MTSPRRGDPKAAKRRAAMRDGWALASAHPLLAPMANRCHLYEAGRELGRGYAGIIVVGAVYGRPDEGLEPGEWAFVFAHLLLHLGLEHFPVERNVPAWNAACDVVVHRVLRGMRLGACPQSMQCDLDEYSGDERRLYERFELEGVPDALRGIGSGDPITGDLLTHSVRFEYYNADSSRWPQLFARGLVEAVHSAVGRASGTSAEAAISDRTPIGRARSWVLTNFPLLGALATAFRFVVDRDVCQRMDISVAAVAESVAEIYLNPTAGLDEQEARFVIAHELLHVGLRHMTRRLGRDPYLWNVACDYVINQWLI
ncbi:MAG: peptidase, partial [Candidatus Eisenbacteria bacterium]|nr:peptidase [Candidatus Eisenbacteria bacterium]